MAIATAQVTVGVTATQLAGGDPDWQEVTVKNIGTATVYIGDATVTTTTGYALAQNDVLTLRLNGPEELYGVVAAATQPVAVLRKQVG